MTKSLWPDEISVIKEVPPVSILREQAALLGEKTRNLVTAEVDSGTVNEYTPIIRDRIPSFRDTFYLVAPALDNYRFELFRVTRQVDQLYPIEIYSSALGIDEGIVSENELLEKLADIFSHPKTINIVQSMLIQSGWEPKGAAAQNGETQEDEIPF
jgi:hypothetical protein